MSLKAYFRQFMTILPLLLHEFIMGIGYSWIAIAVKHLEIKEHWTSNQISWVASIHEIGHLVTPPITGLLIDHIGRKPLLISVGVLFLIWSTIVTLTQSFIALCLARFLFGCGVGISDPSNCIYVGEVTFPNIRGRFLASETVLFRVGTLGGILIGVYLPYYMINIIPVILCIIFVVTSFTMVETPYYYVIKGNYTAAERALDWLYDGNDVEPEFKHIKQHVEEISACKPNIRASLSDNVDRKMCLLVIGIATLAMSTGYFTLNSYAIVTFASTANFTPEYFTVLLTIGQAIACMCSLLLIDRIGRRFLLLLCSGLSALLHFTSAGLYFTRDVLFTDMPGFAWIVFATFTSYTMLYSLGFAPGLYAIRSELFPQQLRGFGNVVTVCLQSICGFLLSYIYPHVTDYVGVFANFTLYAICSTVMFTLIFFYLPETKGKSLVEIQESFKTT